MTKWVTRVVCAVGALALTLASCGDGSADGGDRPVVVVTTDVLGDLVGSMVDDAAEVVTIMPAGASPHDFQASARQARDMRTADLLIVNGAGFEEGLLDTIEAAESDGVAVHEAIDGVDVLEVGEAGHDHEGDDHAEEAEGDDHADDEAEGDDHADDEGEADDHADDDHDHTGIDPHFTTDPVRVAQAVRGIAAALVENVPGLDTPEQEQRVDDLLASLAELDEEVRTVLDVVAEDDRVLVTNHRSLAYFADRYHFEVVGTVIPATSTTDAATAADLAALAEVVDEHGVPAIFADTSSPTRVAEALASDAGGIEVVTLHTESLGEEGSGADTYAGMVRTNAEAIAAALG